MKASTTLLGLTLLACAGFAHAAPDCTLKLKGDDRMQLDLKTATVSASCPFITIELTHVGKLPVQAMGHNVVISMTRDLSAIAAAGMKAGAAANYMPKAGSDYSFFCSSPGHSAIMKGKLVVTR